MIMTVGPHRLRHGDIMDGLEELMQGEKARLFYSDPPWGPGNLKYWQTMNVKNTGAERKTIDFNAFLDALFRVCTQHVDGMVLMEYGVRWHDDIVRAAGLYGLYHRGVAMTTYGSARRPLHLHVMSTRDIAVSPNIFHAVQGKSGYDAVKTACMPFAVKGEILLDPCCGMGYSAQAAIDLGMRFVGNELNEVRLRKTFDRLERHENLS